MQNGARNEPTAPAPRWLPVARLAAVGAVTGVIVVAIVLFQRRGPATTAVHRDGATAAATAPSGAAAGPLGALQSGPPEKGRPAPNFALSDLDGRRVELASLRGKVVVVNFWATWCGPCRQEFPELQKAATNLAKNVVVLALDQAESADRVAQFRDEFGVTFTILLDSRNAVADSYQFRGIPDTVFIDREGIVRDVVRGPLSAGSFQYKINQLLSAP